MTKKELATVCIDINKEGLELGPLDHPLLSKKEANVFYVDHMNLEDLKEKYKTEPVDIEKITKPDYVLSNKSLKTILNKKKFHYVVASHVIEHVPDIITWFCDIADILEDEGVLSLIVPDKRFTFDIMRNTSIPADIIGAYLDKQTKPTSATMYDFTMECRANIIASEVWANQNEDYSKKPYIYSREVAWQKCLDNANTEKYIDCHCHVFTPYSFVKILKSLIELNLLEFEVAHFSETKENSMEFFVSLRKTKKNNESKIRSLPNIKRDPDIWQVQTELTKINKDFSDIEHSASWKITKPLRKVKKIVKRK